MSSRSSFSLAEPKWKGFTDNTRLVAHQGVDALFAGKDAVGGGDRATKRKSFLNRLLPERMKAERHARGGLPTN